MEQPDGNTIIENLSEIPVKSPEDIFTMLRFGENHRHYGETNMNERSSRSHTIFRLIIESSVIEEDENEEDEAQKDSGAAVTVSHLNIVDLAGSERASQTGASGERLREGGNINKSLLTLGKPILPECSGRCENNTIFVYEQAP